MLIFSRILIIVLLASLFSPVALAQTHVNGTIIISGGTIYKIENGLKRGFPTVAAFLSHNYQFFQARPATTDDLILPQGSNMDFADGSLVNDNGTVFMVNQGGKRGFTSAAVFTGLGFKFGNVFAGSTANFQLNVPVVSLKAPHPEGTLINDGRTIWQLRVGGRSGIPNLQVLNSYGFTFSRAVKANAFDLQLPILPNVVERDNGGILAADCAKGSFDEQFLCLINDYRIIQGLNALGFDPLLNITATKHSVWMNQNSNLSHIGVNNSTFFERCLTEGTTCDAENIASGFTSAISLFEAWKNSPGHAANMRGNHTVLGLGRDGAYATNVFR